MLIRELIVNTNYYLGVKDLFCVYHKIFQMIVLIDTPNYKFPITQLWHRVKTLKTPCPINVDLARLQIKIINKWWPIWGYYVPGPKFLLNTVSLILAA